MTPLPIPLPNPNTPLAFFTPTAAYQASVAVYAHAASVSIIIWDILDTMPEAYTLLFRNKISPATVTYFLSRIGALGYSLSSIIFQTAPIGSNCGRLETIADSFYPVALSFTGLLFFFRLRAIYNQNPLVIRLFFVMWVGLFGCTMVLPIQSRGTVIGNTKYCIDAAVPNTVYISIFAPLIHDTLVFTAISYRLAQNYHMPDMSLQEGFKVAFFGNYLPRFTKSLLLDGQKYYLISLISNLIFVIMVYDTGLPIALRSLGAATNVMLTNIMACRVYRKTRFGQFQEDIPAAPRLWQANSENQIMPSFPVFAYANDPKLGQDSLLIVENETVNVPCSIKSSPTDDRIIVIERFERCRVSEAESI